MTTDLRHQVIAYCSEPAMAVALLFRWQQRRGVAGSCALMIHSPAEGLQSLPVIACHPAPTPVSANLCF